MAVLRLTVEVYEGSKHLKVLRKRKIKKLPCKIAGAQFEDRIFPLYQYRSKEAAIDILDKGYLEFACEDWESEKKVRCADDGDSVAFNWRIETQDQSRFLLFDGTDKSLRTVIDELRKYRLVDTSQSTAQIPDPEIFRNDWFVRLDQSRPMDEVEPIIQKILSENEDAVHPATESTEELSTLLPEKLQSEFSSSLLEDASVRAMVSWLGGQVEIARKNENQARDARTKEIGRLREKNAELGSKLKTVREDIKSLKIKHENEIGVVQEEKERLINKLNKETAGTLETYVIEKQLSSIVASIDSLSQKFESEQNLRAERESFGVKLEELTRQNEELESRLRIPSGPVARYAPGSKLPSTLVLEALRQFTNLAFHNETPEIILSKFMDPSNLFELFRQLDSGKEVPSRTIANAKGWREVKKHINTGNTSGNASMGRIYLRKEADNKLCVVVHHKRNETEQSRMIAKLRDASFFRPLKF